MASLTDLNNHLIATRKRRRSAQTQPSNSIDILDVIGANLHDHQATMLASFKRFGHVCCHRRRGKSYALLAHLFDRAWWCPSSTGKYGYFTAVRGQTLNALEEQIEQWVPRIPGAKSTKLDQALIVRMPTKLGGTAKIILDGLNHTKQRGAGWDGLVLDECAEIMEYKWTAELYPALTDPVKAGLDALGRRNQFAILSGTPLGKNWFYRWHLKAKAWALGEPYRTVDKITGKEVFEFDEEWSCTYEPLSKTKALPDAEVERARLLIGEEDFLREFELDWNAAAKGSYFGALLRELRNKGQIGSFPHIPDLPVHSCWDIGLHGTVIWFFQIVADRVRFIDAFSHSDDDFVWYLTLFLPSRREALGYRYGTHYFPHDAANREGSTDREMEIIDALETHGMGDYEIVKRHDPLVAGHDAVRWLLPKSEFHEPLCEEELGCMAMYRRKENPTLETMTGVLKDGSDHAVDAYRQAAFALKQAVTA